MKEIQLAPSKHGNFVALVDDEDYERVSQYHWCVLKGRNNVFYAQAWDKGHGRSISMSRFIMKVKNRHILVDHEDRNGLNNQKYNLRLCTNAQNMCNRSIIQGKKLSKYLGVYRMSSKWLAKLTHKQNPVIIGYFDTEIEAAEAYNKAALQYHGEFARPNII